MSDQTLEQKPLPPTEQRIGVPQVEHSPEDEVPREEETGIAGEKEPQKPESQPTKTLEKATLRRRPKLPPAPVRDEITVKVEKILEEGFADDFQRLSPIAKQEFRLRGEQTASKIAVLLKATHVKVKKIIKLIIEWLRLLPGINKYFLEQEAKIKADRIVELHERMKEKK